MNHTRLRYFLWGLVGLAIVAAAGLYAFWPGPPLPTGATFGGPFVLQTTAGDEFTQADLPGTPTLIFFGYTWCPDVCPTTMAEAVGWRQELGLGPETLRIVFVTVDPARDTPEKLGVYLSAFGDIVGLTGSPQAIDTIKTGFGIYSEIVGDPGSADYLVNHTASVILLNARAQFAGTIAYGEARQAALDKLARLTGR